ncbi:AraC family transcriptional regulator [Neobacillus niacini]|uniref:AraC family transcriptional regulator n=1 Tax=Neobacillus niacini TaxID=86668 RepID=UPI002FFE83C8
MKRIELETFFDSIIPEPINEEKILRELTPPIVVVNGVPVYKFNRTVDIHGLLFEENITLQHQVYDHDVPIHMHDFIEIMFVYRGNCIVSIKGKRISLNRGELILINKGVPHSVAAISKKDIVINMFLKKDYLSPSFLKRLSQKNIISEFIIQSLVSFRNQNQFLIFKPSEDSTAIEIMENIMCEFFDRDFCSSDIIDSYLVVLFSTLIRYNNNQLSNNKNVSLIDFLKYIEENYRDCSLVKMGQTFSFNPSYLSTYLKKRTGKSFKELLQIQRLNQAALLLCNSDLSIPEIAEEVGYSSLTFFYKKFKELYKVTPNKFREQ